MLATDFKKHGITKFTPAEVENTGSALMYVQLRLMIALQAFRIELDRRVGLLNNGMTTGTHGAKEHPMGLAVDGYLYPEDGSIEIPDIFKAALTAGFHGIGIYWNGTQYSFHLDLRPEWGFWFGSKDGKDDPKGWAFSSLFITP